MNVEKIIYSPGAFLILGAKLAKNVVGCGCRALKFASGHAAKPGWQFFFVVSMQYICTSGVIILQPHSYKASEQVITEYNGRSRDCYRL